MSERERDWLRAVNGDLDAPCCFCGYKGAGYFQVQTHSVECPWYSIGGLGERHLKMKPMLAGLLEQAARADRPEQPWSVSDEMRKLAERAVEAQRNDKRTEAEIIADGVSFVMGEGFDPPVARPEPAQPTNAEIDWAQQYHGVGRITAEQYAGPQEPAQPVAPVRMNDAELRAALITQLTATPSHPAPSKAGAVDLSYWCPFKDSACGDDPARRCADCAQPAKGDATELNSLIDECRREELDAAEAAKREEDQ